MKNNLNIFSVEGKRVLITGAANGNGKAIAKGFGNAGSELFLLDIDDKNLEIVANDIERETDTDGRYFDNKRNSKRKSLSLCY